MVVILVVVIEKVKIGINAGELTAFAHLAQAFLLPRCSVSSFAS